MAYYDLDAFLNEQDEIKFTYKGEDYFVDPDIDFMDLLRAFRLMKGLSGAAKKIDVNAVAAGETTGADEDDIEETVKTFETMGELLEAILGEENWSRLTSKGFGYRSMQNLLPWLMTQITNTQGDEPTPETPEEEEERALLAAVEGDGQGKEASVTPPKPSPESSEQFAVTSLGTTGSGTTNSET